MSRFNRSLGFAVLAAAFVAVSPAYAQVSRLDRDRLIEGLQQRDMSELLLHLAKTEKFADPTEPKIIEIQQLRIRANSTALDPEERVKSCEQALAAYRALIDDPKFAEHPKRAMWQTDFAEVVFLTYFQVLKGSAGEFLEFGLLTADQQKAAFQFAPEALRYLTEAERQFFSLQNQLPKLPDFADKYQNTGLFDRMMKEYWNQRTKFYTAYAAYYVALLPDWAPYYKNLGKDPVQAKTPGEERKRLLKVAVTSIKPLAEKVDGNPKPVRIAAQSLLARISIAAGDLGTASGSLDFVLKEKGVPPLGNFTAQLARIKLYHKQGKKPLVDQELKALRSSSFAKGNILMYVLTYDLEHRLLLEGATTPAAQNAAFEPFERLLKENPDPNLAAFINERFERRVAGENADLSKQPVFVIAGLGERATIEGFQAMKEAQEEHAEAARKKLVDAAAKKLKEAQKLNAEVLKRADAPPAIRGKALYYQGYAVYLLNPDEQVNFVEAMGLFAEVVEKHSDLSEAADAAGFAVGRMREVLESVDAEQQGPWRKELLKNYSRMLKALLAKMPESKITDDQRSYYVFEVLLPTGQYTEAISVLQRVPRGHPTYFDSQRAMLDCMFQLHQRKTASGQASSPDDLLKESAKVRKEAEDAILAVGDAAKPLDALVASGFTRLVDAEVSLSRRDDLKAAVTTAVNSLKDFEKKYGGDSDVQKDLVRRAIERRMLAYATAGDAKAAEAEGSTLLARYPQDAAPVIDSMLRDMVVEVDRLNDESRITKIIAERDEMLQRATNLAKTGELLARLLLDWAQKRGLQSDDLLQYQLIVAKSMTLSDKGAEAVAYLKPLVDSHPNDAIVLYHLAEANFAAGQDAKTGKMSSDNDLKQAQDLYNKLIKGIQPADRKDPILGRVWWHAWLRTLQCSSLRNKGVEGIADRVEILRGIDDNLGGPVFRASFERLERAHKK